MRALSGLLVWLAACGGEAPEVLEPGVWTERERVTLQRLRLDVTPRPDPSNAWSDDPAAARLGQALFFDKGLSPSGQFSCATCHKPELHFTDGLPLAVAAGVSPRHTPTVVGSQFGAWFFWDGRADSLWAQAIGPIEHPLEMDGDRTHLAHHVAATYAEPYEAIFGTLPDLSDPARFPPRARPVRENPRHELAVAWEGMAAEDQHAVTEVLVNAAKALAAYQRQLVPQDAPFDHYVDAVLQGDSTGGGHLDEAQVRGLSLFLRDAQCVACHNGPLLTDRAFHNLGLPEPRGFDSGRASGAHHVLASPFNCKSQWSDADDCPELRHLDTEFPDFRGAFKTPTLRQVAQTAPYMHNGGFATLEEVVTFYSELPGEPLANHRVLMLQRLHLDPQQIGDLVAFLNALSGPPVPAELAGPPASLAEGDPP